MLNIYLKTLPLCFFYASITANTAEIIPATIQKLHKNDSQATIINKAANVLPSQRQVDYHKREYSGFIHFGPNTFTGVEWGNGMEDPTLFNPTNIDTDQWCQTMKKAGMKTAIITIKHHDGFVLYQSRYTKHGVMSSPFKEGKGDILSMLVKSCRAQGVKIGVYLSPADLFQMESPTGLYGNLSEYRERTIPKQVANRPFADKRTFTVNVDDYNEYFMSQLFELLTEYGPIHEVWFDGAHPKNKGGQKYVRDQWYKLIHTLAPNAVILGGPDARWVGNEHGGTRHTEWSIIPIQAGQISLDRPDKDLGSRERLFDPTYKVYGKEYIADQLNYIVAEVDTSIRDGWFYRDDTHQKIRSADDIFDIYERTIGGNAVFLLNIPPNTQGRFSKKDVEALIDSGNRIRDTYDHNLLAGANAPSPVIDNNEHTFWQTSETTDSFEITLPQPQTINRFVLQEAIATHGLRIEEHQLDAWLNGKWQEVAKGTTVGYKKILRFNAITSNRFRLRIPKSRTQATVSSISAHYYQPYPSAVNITQTDDGMIEISLPDDDVNLGAYITTRHQWLAEIAWFFGISATLEQRERVQEEQAVIHFTTDGSTPSLSSKIYNSAFKFSAGTVKAKVFQGKFSGPTSQLNVSIPRHDWQVLSVSSEYNGKSIDNAFDNNPDSYWQTKRNKLSNHPHHIAIDLGTKQSLSAFTYLPRQGEFSGEGMIESGYIESSHDGTHWTKHDNFSFGNIVNDPALRTHYFAKPIVTQYIKVVSTSAAKNTPYAGAAEIGFLPSKMH